MSLSDNNLYEFGEYRLNAAEKLLISGNGRVSLTPKVFEMLFVFLESGGKLVSKDDLMNKVWANSFVEESNLTFTIRQLRKVLNDDARSPKYIETVSRRGYRFIAEVEKSEINFAPVKIISTKLEPAVFVDETPLIQTSDLPNRKYIAFGLCFLVLTAFVFSGFIYREINKPSNLSFEKIGLNRITSNGKSVLAAISADGKYIVHAKEERGKQSLLLRQTEENKDLEIIAPQQVNYWGITISPDSRKIFYTVWETNNSDAALYQIPILGGTPQKILEMIDSGVSFSPDGKRLAYFRSHYRKGFSHLVTVNLNGTDEKIIAVKNHPETFDTKNASPAWSPDGKMIAAALASMTLGEKNKISLFNLEDDSQIDLTEKYWTIIEQIAWLKDQSGLIIVAGEKSFQAKQLWRVSFPDGEYRQITNDLSDYNGISLTADSQKIVSVQNELTTNIWVSDNSDISKGKSIFSETGKNGDTEGLVWSPDNKLILRSSQNSQDNIWETDADGNNQKQLTFNVNDIEPSISFDGEKIVFASKETGIYRLWQTDRKGESRRLITSGEEDELFPNCSKISNFCVYQKGWKKAKIFKVSLETGETKPLITKTPAIRPALSPDGKSFVYFTITDKDEWVLIVADIADGRQIKQFPIAKTVVSRYVRWSPNGINLAYIDTQNDVSNIFYQPIDGGAASKTTDFDAEEIFYFDWSKDGQKFAVSRGTFTNNVVAISITD